MAIYFTFFGGWLESIDQGKRNKKCSDFFRNLQVCHYTKKIDQEKKKKMLIDVSQNFDFVFAGWSARLLLYTPTDPGSLGGQPGSYCIPQPTLVRWVVSQAPIVYPNRLWFAGWSARFLLYTPTDPGSAKCHFLD